MQDSNEHTEVLRNIPLIPLRDLVVFPSTLVPFIVGRSSSIQALEKAAETDKMIFSGRPDGRLGRQPDPQGHLLRRGHGQDHPDGQDATTRT